MADGRGVRRAWARTEWETGNEAAARCAQPPSFCPYALFLSRIIKKLYMIDTQNRIEECEILDNDLATFKTLWSTAVYFIASNNSFVHARMHFLSHRIKSLRIFLGNDIPDYPEKCESLK